MDVGLLETKHPLETGTGFWEAWHPDAGAGPDGKDLIGSGLTPNDAARDLSKKAGKKFQAHHRSKSKHVGGGPTATESDTTQPGDIHHTGEGETPEEAWAALNADCKKQADGCRAAHAGAPRRHR